MVVFPNAKINLGLNVLRKRNDGYHDIETCMVGVDWCDVLEVVPAKGETDSLHVSGIALPCPDDKNLVIKALKVLREDAGLLVPAVDAYLHKNIPDGAGLGGGSSDAAFMIKALNALFSLNLSGDEMKRYAAKVGSDCAFFIHNEPAISSGRGDVLKRVDGLDEQLKPYKVVIVKPKTASVSTAEAYGRVVLTPEAEPIADLLRGEVGDWGASLGNSFEESVFVLCPEVASIKDKLLELGADYASMSGSGSAVFGLFKIENFDENSIRNSFNGYYVHIGHFIF